MITRVWRVRWWVRAVASAALALALLMASQPQWLNPQWQDGMPVSEWPAAAGFIVGLAFAVWAAFRSHVVLADGHVRVVNPLRTRTFPAAEVVAVTPGELGARFELASGRSVSAFAIGCTALYRGPEPRWVDVARAVTGREPDHG